MFKNFKNKMVVPSAVALVFGIISLTLIMAYSNCAPPKSANSSNLASGGTPNPFGPLSIMPPSVTIMTSAVQSFAAFGGSGIYTFSVTAGGGSVVQTTGVYTAPATAGVATVTVADSSSNTAVASITITSPASTPPPSATPAPTSAGGPYYSCPVFASENCDNTSLCQSTCVGQISNNSSCTWYSMNAVPNKFNCTAVPSIPSAYSCPIISSNSCQSGSLCESTCVGQFQGAATCTSRQLNAVGTTHNCTLQTDGNLSLYLCPVRMSNTCQDMSQCESTCLGQYQNQATCNFKNLNAVPTTVQCTSVGSSF